MNKHCQAGQSDRDGIWSEWCKRVQDKRCRGCKWWTGRIESVYQMEKKAAQRS